MSWDAVFGGWDGIGRTVVLGTAAYMALVLMLRVTGKRTLSKMSAFDLVVTIALGSTLASVLTSSTVSLAQGVIALALLVALQYLNTFIAVRWPAYRNALKAEPTLVFSDGSFLEQAMLAQRVNRDEILAAMRAQGAAEPGDVAAVVLEADGSMSVLRSGGAALEPARRSG